MQNNLSIKRAVDWKQTTWDETANKIHLEVIDHYDKLCKSVYKEGRYNTNLHELQMEPYAWAGLEVQ